MAYAVTAVVVFLVIVAIVKAASGGRYAKMTEEEFEKQAQRSSRVGAAVMGLQKIIDPGHRVEYAQEQSVRAEADSAETGDPPHAHPPAAGNHPGASGGSPPRASRDR